MPPFGAVFYWKNRKNQQQPIQGRALSGGSWHQEPCQLLTPHTKLPNSPSQSPVQGQSASVPRERHHPPHGGQGGGVELRSGGAEAGSPHDALGWRLPCALGFVQGMCQPVERSGDPSSRQHPARCQVLCRHPGIEVGKCGHVPVQGVQVAVNHHYHRLWACRVPILFNMHMFAPSPPRFQGGGWGRERCRRLRRILARAAANLRRAGGCDPAFFLQVGKRRVRAFPFLAA